MSTAQNQPTAYAVQEIPITLIDESPLNPRKDFPKEAIADLAADIRKHGVLQPVMARISGAAIDGQFPRYELIFGARRLRASRIAGLVTIPATVRDFTDVEVIEHMLVENAKREGIHPMEEAEAYETLHLKHKISVDELAAKVGKSKGYIYQRMKLLALTPASRKLFHEGKLDATKALLVARIPNAPLQEEAAKEIVRGPGGLGMSAREATDFVQRRYMLRLADAPFKWDDADLVPAAGSCTTCPKRTGNQKELFADVKSADTCTDPECFASKRDAQTARLLERAKADGKPIIPTKKAFPYEHSPSACATDYVDLEQGPWADPKRRTWKELLKDGPAPAIAVDHDGVAHELVLAKEAHAFVKKAGIKLDGDAVISGGKLPPHKDPSFVDGRQDDYKEQRKKEQAARAIREKVSAMAVVAIVAKAERAKPDAAFLRLVADLLLDQGNITYPSTIAVAHRRGLANDIALSAQIQKMPADKLRGLIIELLLAGAPIDWSSYTDALNEAAEHFSVHLKALEQAAKKPKPTAAEALADRARADKSKPTVPVRIKVKASKRKPKAKK